MERGKPNVGSPDQMTSTAREWKCFTCRTGGRYGCDKAVVVVSEEVATDEKGCLLAKQRSIEFPLDPVPPPARADRIKRVLSIQPVIPVGPLETLVKAVTGAPSCGNFDTPFSWSAKLRRIGITVYSDALDTRAGDVEGTALDAVNYDLGSLGVVCRRINKERGNRQRVLCFRRQTP